jgi:hypothetical protein
MSKDTCYIHFIEAGTGRMVSKQATRFPPEVGDEIRLNNNTFYACVSKVWVYDEPECPHARLNMRVEKA